MGIKEARNTTLKSIQANRVLDELSERKASKTKEEKKMMSDKEMEEAQTEDLKEIRELRINQCAGKIVEFLVLVKSVRLMNPPKTKREIKGILEGYIE